MALENYVTTSYLTMLRMRSYILHSEHPRPVGIVGEDKLNMKTIRAEHAALCLMVDLWAA